MLRLLSLFLLLFLPGSLPAQSSPTLVGTWRLISMVRDTAGQVRPFWDDRPSGRIMYTADGHMMAQLYDSRRPRLGVRWDSAGPAEAQVAYAGLVTYFGRYQIDAKAGTVTHTVEDAMAPDWIGSRLVRGYRFLTPNRVELRVITDATGRRVTNGSILIWERVVP